MATYCKGSTKVEAFRWTADADQADDPVWLIDAIRTGLVRFQNVGSRAVKMVLDSPSHQAVAALGDWIVRDQNGHIYPCRPSSFEGLYSPLHHDEMCA